MKRLIFILMAFVLVFTVFAANTMLVFAEGEDVSTGTEETLPEGEGEGGEQTPPENEGTEEGGEQTPPENEGTEDSGEQTPPENEGTTEDEEDLSASEELMGLVGKLKDEIFGLIEDVFNFITSNETYKNIATAIIGVLAILIVPFLVAVLVVVFVAMAAVITISSALISLVEAITGLVVGAMFIM